ncbi:MAG: replication initiator protein A [Eubacteriales bacterium]
MSLSAKNGWPDKDGRVYKIFTPEEIQSSLGCAVH